MDTNNNSKRMHPLIAGAAVSVMVASLTGVAAMTGLLPNSHGEGKAAAETAQATPAKVVESKPAAVAKVAKPAQQLASYDEERRPAPAPAPARENYRSDALYRSSEYGQSMTQVAQPARVCNSCGRVESVHPVQSQASPSGVGVVGGAVVGGLLGNQVGGGTGRGLATAAGVVGGAVVGNQVEQRSHQGGTAYQIGVRLDNGGYQTYTQESVGDLNIGNRVRIDNGRVYRY